MRRKRAIVAETPRAAGFGPAARAGGGAATRHPHGILRPARTGSPAASGLSPESSHARRVLHRHRPDAMSFFTNLRAERLIAEVKAAADTGDAAASRSRSSQARPVGHPADHRCAGQRRQARDGRLRRRARVAARQQDAAARGRGPRRGNQRTRRRSPGRCRARRATARSCCSAARRPGDAAGPARQRDRGAEDPPRRARPAEAAYNQEPTEKAALFRIVADIADAAWCRN